MSDPKKPDDPEEDVKLSPIGEDFAQAEESLMDKLIAGLESDDNEPDEWEDVMPLDEEPA